MVPLHWCMLWLLLPLSSRTQKLPTRDEELFQMQIRDKAFFHDSSVIPDGAEISSYLFRDTPKRYSPCSTSFINKLRKGVSKKESKRLDLLSLDDLQSISEWKWKCWSLSRVWVCVTPWTIARQAPLSMEFSRQESWSGLRFPSPGNLPDPVIEPCYTALQADSLPSEAPGKPSVWIVLCIFL